jgi:hypothetical protein
LVQVELAGLAQKKIIKKSNKNQIFFKKNLLFQKNM